jgi:hypothetical protein
MMLGDIPPVQMSVLHDIVTPSLKFALSRSAVQTLSDVKLDSVMLQLKCRTAMERVMV